MKKYIQNNKESFEDYMNKERNSFNSRSANPATKVHLSKLNSKWE